MKLFDIIKMIIKEQLSSKEIPRVPEPSSEMNEQQNIAAFHQQGDHDGALIPIYHFNALATSRLLPKGGTIVDLGSGTGQYLAYLAKLRPDIQIIGIELAPNMITIGTSFLQTEGLNERVKLILGDMTEFSALMTSHVDLISSVFSLHHLPSLSDLSTCVSQMENTRRNHGSAVWIFDHARPKNQSTPEVFPEIFTPNADKAFKLDSRNSLIAAFSFREMTEALDAANIGPMHHEYSKFMNLYQIHWLESNPELCKNNETIEPSTVELSKHSERDFKSLIKSFKDLP